MLIRLAMKLVELSPAFRRFLWRRWYQHLAGYKVSEWKFMNYGYSSLDPNSPPLELEPADEPNRYSIQLYNRVASQIKLEGLEVLEVGCGRGGGASFVKRYHHPRLMTGMDFSAKAVKFCKENHKVEGLIFSQGDAEAIPFQSRSFDAVLNVESSHCYGSMPKFLAGVKRVLKPGGHFLFADLRAAVDFPKLQQHIQESGMTIVEQEDITANVVEALKTDSDQRRAMIEKSVSPRMLNFFREFAALEGSEMYAGFRDRTTVYTRYLLRKDSSAPIE